MWLIRALRGVISADEWVTGEYEVMIAVRVEVTTSVRECEPQVRMSVHGDNDLSNEYL